MEGLKQRIIALAAVLAVTGGASLVLSHPSDDKSRNEAWLETITPAKIAGYELQQSPENPKISYRMDKMTYDTLNPYGIVARVFNGQGASIDTVIIGSQKDDSFHDPRQCFTSQFWELNDLRTIQIPTKSRGNIPATFVNLKGRDRNSIAVFFYRGPGGFFPSTMGLKFDMLRHELATSKAADGVFYRFIAQGTTTSDQLLSFISQYVDEADQVSKGFM
jgi:Protein of unknown function (DUF3485)